MVRAESVGVEVLRRLPDGLTAGGPVVRLARAMAEHDR